MGFGAATPQGPRPVALDAQGLTNGRNDRQSLWQRLGSRGALACVLGGTHGASSKEGLLAELQSLPRDVLYRLILQSNAQ